MFLIDHVNATNMNNSLKSWSGRRDHWILDIGRTEIVQKKVNSLPVLN